MAKNDQTAHFVTPRGEDGRFLPKEMWSKKDQRAFERMKKSGALKRNPFVRTKKTKEKVWIPPRDPETGEFLPESEWSAAEKRRHKRAIKKGLLPSTAKDRKSGRFTSAKKKKVEGAELVERRDDIYEKIAHLEGLIQGALGGAAIGGREGHVREIVYVPKDYYQRPKEHFVIVDDPRDEDEPLNVHRKTPEQLNLDLDIEDIANDECPPCEFPGLEKMLSEVQETKRLAAAKMQKNLRRRPYKNPLMYRKSFSRRFVDFVDYFRDRPIMALIGVGAVALIGYTLYRLARTYVSTLRPGAMIANGIMSFPGVTPYQITQDDMLWMARSIWGEVNRNPSAWARADVQRGAAAVLWAYANNYMTVGRKRQIFPTFGQFIQAYSQPINPRWDQASDPKCQQNPNMCTSDRLAFRQSLRSKPWSTFPPELQNIVQRFVQGTLANPIGRRTDFRASGTNYRPPDPMVVSGNVFGTDPSARARAVV